MVIVLTLGRSGSSMLMQSLKLLGMNVIGRDFDIKGSAISQKKHEELNPKGYLEEPRIYYGGPASIEFQTLCQQNQYPSACKMDIRHFTNTNQSKYWKNLANDITSILVSYRDPSEQASSEHTASFQQDSTIDAKEYFRFISKFLMDYKNTYGCIDETLNKRLPSLRHKVYFIDYASAKKPQEYIAKLRSLTDIQPTQDQYHLAVSNISPKLFRVTHSSLSKEEIFWARKTGALDVYLELNEFRKAQE